jgi:uncharacterized protein YecT (DUF1311 family)
MAGYSLYIFLLRDKIIMKNIFLLLSLLLFSSAGFAENLSLCQNGEHILFACSTKNNRIISLCAPRNLSARSLIHYRFGQPNKIELVYPSHNNPASQAFTGRAQVFRGGGGVYLRFRKDDYDYILYNGSGKDWSLKGVIILNDEQVSSYFSCIQNPTSKLSADLLKQLNIPLDPPAQEFFPGDLKATSASANAQSDTDLESIGTCYEKAMTTLEIKICANREYGYYDNLLNNQYKKLLKLLPRAQQHLLVDTQKAWWTYRQKECNLMSLKHEGGTMQEVDLVQCYIALNKERSEELDNFIQFYQH